MLVPEIMFRISYNYTSLYRAFTQGYYCTTFLLKCIRKRRKKRWLYSCLWPIDTVCHFLEKHWLVIACYYFHSLAFSLNVKQQFPIEWNKKRKFRCGNLVEIRKPVLNILKQSKLGDPRKEIQKQEAKLDVRIYLDFSLSLGFAFR